MSLAVEAMGAFAAAGVLFVITARLQPPRARGSPSDFSIARRRATSSRTG